MVIGITINNLLRDHISKLSEIYKEITGKDPIEPINPYDLEKSFPKQSSVNSEVDFNVNNTEEIDLPYNEVTTDFDVLDFVYNDASFEVFGRSEESHDGIIRKLKNAAHSNQVTILLMNRESSRSKCATLFFLSKTGFDFETIYFPKRSALFWKHVDALVTDDPKLLEIAPNKKISVKIETEYNKHIPSTLTFKSVGKPTYLVQVIKKKYAEKYAKTRRKTKKH